MSSAARYAAAVQLEQATIAVTGATGFLGGYLVDALLALVEPTRRGDPESVLCWTTLSTRKLADELTTGGHKVGSDTVARLLHEKSFSLQANSKTLEGTSHPDRDAQFSYINDQATAHLTTSDPVISVDTKKKLRHEVAHSE